VLYAVFLQQPRFINQSGWKRKGTNFLDSQKTAEGAQASEKADNRTREKEKNTLNESQVPEVDQVVQNSQRRAEIDREKFDEDKEKEE
jgi:hypothetical protein